MDPAEPPHPVGAPPVTKRELACRLELLEARGSTEVEQNSLSIGIDGSPHIKKFIKRINWSWQETACFLLISSLKVEVMNRNPVIRIIYIVAQNFQKNY